MGSWAHGLLGSLALEISVPMGSWTHGLLGSSAHGILGSWAHGLLLSWALGLMGSCSHGLSGTWALRANVLRAQGNMDSWALSLMDSWAKPKGLLGSWALWHLCLSFSETNNCSLVFTISVENSKVLSTYCTRSVCFGIITFYFCCFI
jgi:hypothetical protein